MRSGKTMSGRMKKSGWRKDRSSHSALYQPIAILRWREVVFLLYCETALHSPPQLSWILILELHRDWHGDHFQSTLACA